MPARIDDLLVLDTAVSKTDLAKYLRDREAVLPTDFGGLGDGVANDRSAIQSCFDRAAADQKFAVIPPGTWNVGSGVTLGGGARGLIMQGVIRYTGAANAPATVLTLGDGGTVRNGEKLYLGLQVTRQIQSDWATEADIGIVARNLDASLLELRLVSGFTIGLRTLGDGRGFEDSTLILGRILNNRFGLDVHCATAGSWNTSIRYYGGHFARHRHQPHHGPLWRALLARGRGRLQQPQPAHLRRTELRAAPARPECRHPLPEPDQRHRHHRARPAHGGVLAHRGAPHRPGHGLRVRGRLGQYLRGPHGLRPDGDPGRQRRHQPASRAGVAADPAAGQYPEHAGCGLPRQRHHHRR